MEQSWRWFGPEDVVGLAHIRQAGARAIVTALHHIPYGAVWSVDEIAQRKREIAADASLGLYWNVVESLPIHEDIKLGYGNLTPLFENYRQSMRNLAGCGITTICYNFMPILDWTRTDLAHPLPGGGRALRFDIVKFCAFDCFMLARLDAGQDYAPDVITRAKRWHERASESDKATLLTNINAGLPGAYERYDIPGFKRILERYREVGRDGLRHHFVRFLNEVIPVAEELGVRLCVHPDDPPRSLFGLPRVVSNEQDLAFILDAVPSVANGLTFCTGSLGASQDNKVPALAQRFARHIHFAHLRNVTKEGDGSFMEAEHLAGDVDMVSVVRILLKEQKRRRLSGMADWRIPFRPDHGHELLDDIGRATHPGYPAIGRLRGLAELRGVMAAVSALEGLPLEGLPPHNSTLL